MPQSLYRHLRWELQPKCRVGSEPDRCPTGRQVCRRQACTGDTIKCVAPDGASNRAVLSGGRRRQATCRRGGPAGELGFARSVRAEAAGPN